MNKVRTQLVKASKLHNFTGFQVFWFIGDNDFDFFEIVQVENLQNGAIKVYASLGSLKLSREFDSDREVLVYNASRAKILYGKD